MKWSIIISVAALLVTVTPVSAGMFTLNYNALSQLWQTYENPLDATQPGTTFLTGNTAANPGMTYPSPMGGIVGYKPTLDGPQGTFQQIQIGANFWGTSVTGSGAKTGQVIGAALGTGPTNDLSGFDGYYLKFFNDNDDKWKVNLYMNTGYTDWGETYYYYENGWTEIAPGGSAGLVLDFSSANTWGGGYSGGTSAVQNLDHVTNIGFNIGGDMGAGTGYPSVTDTAHISVVPAPAAVLLGLLGLSAAGIKLRRFA